MALGDHHARDALNDARRLLRAAPEPGWDALEPRVMAAVRATPRGGWPLDVDDPDPDAAPGVIKVSDLVLGAALGRALREDSGFDVIDLVIDSGEGALRGISVQIAGRYGADLMAAADRVRAIAVEVVTEVLGSSFEFSVDVRVSDVRR